MDHMVAISVALLTSRHQATTRHVSHRAHAAIDSKPPARADDRRLLHLAYARIASGNLRGAEAAFRTYVARRPASRYAWLGLAHTLVKLNDHRAAIAAFEEYLRLSPGDEKARLERAHELAALGQARDARAGSVALSTAAKPALAVQAAKEPTAAAADTTTPASTVAATAPDVSELDHAYALLRAGEKRPAAAAFGRYLQTHADNAAAWLDLAYTCQALGDGKAAVDAFNRYLTLKPSDDQVRLERAYALVAAGRIDQARSEFKALSLSATPGASSQAGKELAAMATQQHTSGFEQFSVAEADSRLHDVIMDSEVRYRWNATGAVQPYAVVQLATDTASHASGSVPVILNDHAVIAGLGVRARLGERGNTYVFMQGGEGVSLFGKGSEPDLRLGFLSSSQWGSTAHGRTTLDWSLASYSRYTGNVIGYGQLLHEFASKRPISPVVGLNVAADTKRQYYNNFLEITAGANVRIASGVTLRIGGVQGTYLPVTANRPSNHSYSTIRPQIIFSKSL